MTLRPSSTSQPNPSAPQAGSWALEGILPHGVLPRIAGPPSAGRQPPRGELGRHGLRVAAYAFVTARAYGLTGSECVRVRVAAALHDVGKTLVPTYLLQKRGPLSPSERRRVEAHTVKGDTLLMVSDEPKLRAAAQVALSHHENFDGSGYPHGLAGKGIPLGGRITRVADVFDALTIQRPYRSPRSEHEVLAFLEMRAGTLFDPEVVAALLRALVEYPGLNARLRRLTGEQEQTTLPEQR